MTYPYIPETRSVKIPGATVSYLYYPAQAGNPGPVVIFLHATGFLHWLWHPVARRLSGRFCMIAPYFCDHRCEPPEKGLSWLTLAEDVAAFSGALGLENPYIVGHSMCGAVAAIAAGRFDIAPKRLLLLEPIFLPENFYEMKITVNQHPLAGRAMKRQNSWSDRKQAFSYIRSKPLFAAWDEEALSLYVEHGMVETEDGKLRLACHPRKEAALFMGSMAFNPWPLFPKISCPVLVVEGEMSENRGMIDFKKAATSFPNGKFMTMTGVGHLIPMEKPAAVAHLITEFFSDGP